LENERHLTKFFLHFFFFQKNGAYPFQRYHHRHPETSHGGEGVLQRGSRRREGALGLNQSVKNFSKIKNICSCNRGRGRCLCSSETSLPGFGLHHLRLLQPVLHPRPRADGARQPGAQASGPQDLDQVRDVSSLLPQPDLRRAAQSQESLSPDQVDEEAGQILLQLQPVGKLGKVNQALL